MKRNINKYGKYGSKCHLWYYKTTLIQHGNLNVSL